MSPCTLPALAPRTNGELDAALTTVKAAWATCAAKVDMIATCQAKTQPADNGEHPHE
ncbi:peptidase [Burkholderia multivorans]|nr:peptidase [Burkholderia ubonensis]AYZ66930.1 peptidase [Burkholderia multivorans]KUZ19589.1 peptidase [Burkholderia ubonensis]KUZ30384.1 peptidase [Burkholderia ubonensis]KUZ38501.1 peptidase [Burkholderia ubonensis]